MKAKSYLLLLEILISYQLILSAIILIVLSNGRSVYISLICLIFSCLLASGLPEAILKKMFGNKWTEVKM